MSRRRVAAADIVLPEIDYVAIGKRIRQVRKHFNMTQKDLGKAVALSISFIGHVERGSRKASLETMICIAKVLDTSLDILLTGESKMRSAQIAASYKSEILRGILHILNAHADEWIPESMQHFHEE